MPRYYGDLRADAAQILSDVALHGQSTGWAGDINQVERLMHRLAPYGVTYTDDMAGTWETSALHDVLDELDFDQVDEVTQYARQLRVRTG